MRGPCLKVALSRAARVEGPGWAHSAAVLPHRWTGGGQALRHRQSTGSPPPPGAPCPPPSPLCTTPSHGRPRDNLYKDFEPYRELARRGRGGRLSPDLLCGVLRHVRRTHNLLRSTIVFVLHGGRVKGVVHDTFAELFRFRVGGWDGGRIA